MWTGSTAAPPRSGRIRPDQLRRLLLVIRPARPSLVEVPLADLLLKASGSVGAGNARIDGQHGATATCSNRGWIGVSPTRAAPNFGCRGVVGGGRACLCLVLRWCFELLSMSGGFLPIQSSAAEIILLSYLACTLETLVHSRTLTLFCPSTV